MKKFCNNPKCNKQQLRRPVREVNIKVNGDMRTLYEDIDKDLDYAFFVCPRCQEVYSQGKRLKKGKTRGDLEKQKEKFIGTLKKLSYYGF